MLIATFFGVLLATPAALAAQPPLVRSHSHLGLSGAIVEVTADGATSPASRASRDSRHSQYPNSQVALETEELTDDIGPRTVDPKAGSKPRTTTTKSATQSSTTVPATTMTRAPAETANASNEALRLAEKWVTDAITSWDKRNASRSCTWLAVGCTADNDSYGTAVFDKLQMVKNGVFGNATLEMPSAASMCLPGMLAYTAAVRDYGTPSIFLCTAFFSSPLNVQAMTLLHEALHIAGTTDIKHDKADCMALPAQNKIQNANNYMFYMLEEVASVMEFNFASVHLPEANCTKLPGKICQQNATTCLMLATFSANQTTCEDYCKAHNMLCKDANSTVDDCGEVRGQTAKHARQDRCLRPATRAACWCEPRDSAYLLMPSTSTTTARNSFIGQQR